VFSLFCFCEEFSDELQTDDGPSSDAGLVALGTTAVVAAAALAAACIPSWRAGRVDPASTLRC